MVQSVLLYSCAVWSPRMALALLFYTVERLRVTVVLLARAVFSQRLLALLTVSGTIVWPNEVQRTHPSIRRQRPLA